MTVDVYLKQKWNSNKCQCDFLKKTIKHYICTNNYFVTSRIYSCECKEECGLDEYLKKCTFIKNFYVSCQHA